MKVVDIHSTQPGQNPHGADIRKLYDSPHATIVHLALQPGQRLRRHVTPVDVAFYVLEGTGLVEVGDEQREVQAGCLVDSPARLPHCWHNCGEGLLRVLVIKVPKPTEPTQMLD